MVRFFFFFVVVFVGRSTVEVCFEKKVSFVLKCWNVVDWLICQLVGGLCMVRPCVVEWQQWKLSAVMKLLEK